MMIKHYFRPPKKQFGVFEYAWAENGRATSFLAGESTACIGWVPGTKSPAYLKDGFLKDAWEADLSVRLLLGSGNQKPPDRLDLGPAGFVRHLDTRDFRGAIGLHAPTLYIGDGKPILICGSSICREGFTPFRVGPLEYSSAGISSHCGYVYETGYDVGIRIFLRMKLGFMGRLAAKALTAQWPPWATLMIDYRFDLSYLAVTAHHTGSVIPSQRRYLNWQRYSDYEIESELSKEGYRAFVETGGCLDAQAFPESRDTQVPVKYRWLPSELTVEEIRSRRKAGVDV